MEHKHTFDYEQYLRPYFTVNLPQNEKNSNNNEECCENDWLKKNKDHIVIGKQIKILE